MAENVTKWDCAMCKNKKWWRTTWNEKLWNIHFNTTEVL